MRALAALLLLLAAPASARAYSVLADEAMIDAVWDTQLAPFGSGPSRISYYVRSGDFVTTLIRDSVSPR